MHPSASVSLDTATVWFPPSLRENSSCGVHSPIQLCVLCHFSRARLCNTMDGSPPGSSVHGILQARILDWVAMPFPSQGSNPGLPYCRRILYCLSHQGSSEIQELCYLQTNCLASGVTCRAVCGCKHRASRFWTMLTHRAGPLLAL